MTGEQKDLAWRAVACKHWRWMPGMLAWSALSDDPYVRYLGECLWWDVQAKEILINEPDDPLPDLTDPATLGCLLALVREAWAMPHTHAQANFGPADIWWEVFTPINVVSGDTEAEALVAALEAAP